MITYAKLSQQEVLGKTRTILEAKLRFKEEVAPINRDDVKNRMYGRDLLSNYLNEVEEIRPDNFPGSTYDRNLDKRRTVIIKRDRWDMGIDIKVSSFKSLKREELLNLDALNNFILTGKYPEPPKK
jgi:hypothetical protein